MKLKLIRKIEEAKGTKSFFWEPEKKIDHLPGQFYYFTLPKLNYPDKRGATRHFTISSSPTEPLLMLTTRIREESGYKKTLDELAVGDFVEGEGPNGTFILDESEANLNHVFLAGGIGITPFRSFIKYAVDKNLTTPMHLIYSNSEENEITFKKDLETWSKTKPTFKMQNVITKRDGRIDKEKIIKFLKDWKLEINNCIFWVVGPPPMVDAMEEVLEGLKIPLDHMRSEKFTGY